MAFRRRKTFRRRRGSKRVLLNSRVVDIVCNV